MPTLGQLLAEARPRLAATPFGAPPREALLLLGQVLGLSEAQILAHGGAGGAGRGRAARFRAPPRTAADRRAGRLSLGRAGVLRPAVPRGLAGCSSPGRRPSTSSRRRSPSPCRPALDPRRGHRLGLPRRHAGALEIPGARVVATDLSPGALAVAAGNARRHGVADRVVPGADGPGARARPLPLRPRGEQSALHRPRRGARRSRRRFAISSPTWHSSPPGSGDSILARLFARAARGCGPESRFRRDRPRTARRRPPARRGLRPQLRRRAATTTPASLGS